MLVDVTLGRLLSMRHGTDVEEVVDFSLVRVLFVDGRAARVKQPTKI